MNFQENRSRGHLISRGNIAVWEGDFKLIHNLEKNESLLFNIKNDPYELNNILAAEPEISRQLLSLIEEYLEGANKKIALSGTMMPMGN